MALEYTDRRVDYLLIGGGLAAATAAEEIRKQDAQGSILILTDDSRLPYHRPPLSKEYLRGEIGPDGIYGSCGVYVQLPEWYTEQHVEVLRGVEATALDTRARTVRLADGRTFGFQMLLLATGGRPRRLNAAGADLPGVHVLRTLSDADAIRVQLTDAKPGVVVG